MRVYDGETYRDLTAEEISALEAEKEAADRDYWANTPYDDAVNAKIRERYSESQEFAILRQKDQKPDEYAAYYSYCEECKAYVKEKKGLKEE